MTSKRLLKMICILALGLSMNGQAEQVCKRDSIIETTPSSRYVVKSDNTIIDTQTGLMWKTCVEGVTGNQCDKGSPAAFNWASALMYPRSFNAKGFAGHKDWRLPNIRELSTLVELQCSQPSINTGVFFNAPSQSLWSSSPYLPGPDFYSWQVDFKNGAIYSDDRANTKYIRLTRDSQEN